jgi:hypothetical protein
MCIAVLQYQRAEIVAAESKKAAKCWPNIRQKGQERAGIEPTFLLFIFVFHVHSLSVRKIWQYTTYCDFCFV